MSADEKDPPAEDLEEGEITDDEDASATEAVAAPDEAAAVDDDDAEGGKNAIDVDEEVEEEGGGKSVRSRKEHRSGKRSSKQRGKDKKRHRDRDRDREIDSDEEKKRRLKKKLAALEMQMQNEEEQEDDDEADDEAMGIYASGGSPRHYQRRRRRQRRTSVSDEDGDEEEEDDYADDDEDGGERDGSASPQRKRAKRSREHHQQQQHQRRDRRVADDRGGRGRRRPPENKSSEICQLFMQGKCPKSPERCMFSHDAQPPKIFELCKFYLFERCAKKEKCLYLHKGFPCKYFHTGHRCLDTAESCKFSHEPLNDDTRGILLKHLEAAPKEILGDFPRFNREQALELVCKTECENKGWATHPLMENRPPPQQQQQQQQQPNMPNQGQQFPFGGDGQQQPRDRGFDQPPPPQQQQQPTRGPPPPFGRGGGGGGPPPHMGPPSDGFGGGGGDGFGPPRPPAPMGGGPSGNFGVPLPPAASGGGTSAIQERLVQMSQRGGDGAGPQLGGVNNGPGLLPLPPQHQHPSGNANLEPLAGGGGGGGHFGLPAQPMRGGVGGGERRRKSRWESTDDNRGGGGFGNPLPPPGMVHPESLPPPQSGFGVNNRDFGPPRRSGFDVPPPGHHHPMGMPRAPGFFPPPRPGAGGGPPPPAGSYPDAGGYYENDPQQPGTPPNTEQSYPDDDPFNPASDNRSPPPPSDQSSSSSAPSGMPKAQQKLFDRIQERAKNGAGEETKDASKPKLNESWYSSDEEDTKKTEEGPAAVSLPKELTDVISSALKKPKSPSGGHDSSSGSEQPAAARARDPRKRDPRQRDPRAQQRNRATEESERDNKILEMDLGSVLGDLDLPSAMNDDAAEEEQPPHNEMGLPFKPHVVASVAKEIDASIYSHSPLVYRLRTIAVTKPDYTDLISRHQRLSGAQAQDPRLRRYVATAASAPVAESYSPGQDLANRGGGAVKRRDPRRKD